MRFLTLFLLLLLTSCHSSKKEWEIVWVWEPSNLLWEEKSIPCFKDIKKDAWVLTTPILSEKRIPHNIYHYGLDTIMISSSCYYDAILLSANDLLIDSKKLTSYVSEYSKILATNIYIKFNMKGFEKYIIKEALGNRIAIYSIIADDNNPTKAFHINDYRIENPLFEINRLNSKIKPDKYIIFLLTDKEISHKNKEYFNTIVNGLSKKPQIIFTKTDKKLRISNTLIYPLPLKVTTIKSTRVFGFTKLKEFNVKSEINYMDISVITKMIKKTEEEFNTTIFYTSKPLADNEISHLIAKGITNFLTSDIVIIPNDIVKFGIKTGDVLQKDIYKIIKNPEDRLVYIKARGENIESIIQTFNKNTVIYINSKNIKEEKEVFLKSKIYRVITTMDFIKKNDEILNYIMEFTVLNIKIKQPIIWYFKKLKKI